ncbi:HNH endonuclease signature motif containing protein, partial [Nocardioides sp.]|uniref:HNH endonuclease signature motif containing protein n=1 Tax=Nocardioides sp. TaxID=35761 RepID=UPI00271A3C11
KPVIDLNTNLSHHGYVPSTAIAEQVDLRDRRCVFPFCTRTRTDRDHRQPYDDGGPTESGNIARLCRGHHRAKTFSAWTYDMPAPGVYVWHSPAGNTLLVDRRREP